MIGRRRVRAVDRDDVHAGDHLVEAVPIGRLERLLDLGRDAPAGCDSGSAGRTPWPAWRRPGRSRPMPTMPSRLPKMRWPSIQVGDQPCQPLAPLLEHVGAFGQPARHRNDQRHGHVGGVFGQHARRIGDEDRAVPRRLQVDIVDAGAELGDQLEIGAGLAQHRPVDAIGNGRHQHIGDLDRVDQLFAREGLVFEIEPCVEKLAQPRLHHVGELARDDNERSVSHYQSS